MSSGGGSDFKPQIPRSQTGLEDEQLSRSQEATPLPMLFGMAPIAVTWISRIYKLKARQAPAERPGKK